MKFLRYAALAATAMLAVSGCGQEDAFTKHVGTSDGGTGGTLDPGTATWGLTLDIAETTLPPEGSTQLTATLADSNGTLYTQSASIEFTSDCFASGLATIEPASTNTTTGTAQATYTAGPECTGTDPITATTTVDTQTLTANGTVTIGTVAAVSGIPAQDGFSLSASDLAPEALEHVGEQVTVTAQLRDRYNNPVQDGTQVFFQAEAGDIGASCQTVSGACSVTWTSTSPAPNAGENEVDGATSPTSGTAPLGQPYGGRVTILAYAVGEESFTDANGNGAFDVGESYGDLPEAWRDDDEDGSYDPGNDGFFADFNTNSAYDVADGQFNGCEAVDACAVHVRAQVVLVMSGSTAWATWTNDLDVTSEDNAGTVTAGTATTTVYISDINHQRMPTGTTIAVSTDHGTIVTPAELVVPPPGNDNKAFELLIELQGEGVDGSGTVTVTVTTPKGTITPIYIPVTETVTIL